MILKYSIHYISRMDRPACMQFSTVIQGHSVYPLFNGELVELPTILDSLFHGLVNTISIPIGMEGGGWWAATR